jgi:hypothetical protein
MPSGRYWITLAVNFALHVEFYCTIVIVIQQLNVANVYQRLVIFKCLRSWLSEYPGTTQFRTGSL